MKALPRTVALVAALAAVACATPRGITRPVEGADTRTYPDSAKYVYEAATYAITDEGIGLRQADTKAQLVESNWVDVSTLHHISPQAAAVLAGGDRRVRFQFRAVPAAGGTQLVGEALIRPTGGGNYADEMAPPNHPAREVLSRMFDNVTERLDERRAKRQQR
jgi:hypothetical protein